jgi:hypothetical protein
MSKDENDLVVFDGQMFLSLKQSEKMFFSTLGCHNLPNKFLSRNLMILRSYKKARTISAHGLSIDSMSMRDIQGCFCHWPSYHTSRCCYASLCGGKGGQDGQGQKEPRGSTRCTMGSHSSIYQQIKKVKPNKLKIMNLVLTYFKSEEQSCDFVIFQCPLSWKKSMQGHNIFQVIWDSGVRSTIFLRVKNLPSMSIKKKVSR